MKKLWLDTECGGLDPKKNGILSLALIYEENNEVIDKGYWEMNPTGTEIAPKALEVNGFSLEQINNFTPWERVKPQVEMFLQTYVKKFDKADKFLACGMNTNFDIQFFIEWFKACGDPYLGSYIKLGKYIDIWPTYSLLEDLEKVPILENSKLETMCQYFNVPLINSHNSLADIEATREVYKKMRNLLI